MEGWIILAGGFLVGVLSTLGWRRSERPAGAPDPAGVYLQGYHAGWADRDAALRRALGQETTGCYSLEETIRQANERMRQ